MSCNNTKTRLTPPSLAFKHNTDADRELWRYAQSRICILNSPLNLAACTDAVLKENKTEPGASQGKTSVLAGSGEETVEWEKVPSDSVRRCSSSYPVISEKHGAAAEAPAARNVSLGLLSWSR